MKKRRKMEKNLDLKGLKVFYSFDVGTLWFYEIKPKTQKTSSLVEYLYIDSGLSKVGLIAQQKVVPRTYGMFCHPGMT